jgi:predicted alpha/beta hydrolase
VEKLTFTPAQLGVREVGHLGYYRAAVGERLWPQILAWLKGKGLVLQPEP